ncbi:hypothetical protein RugamoR1_14810 [Rugamonas sp. R1(2021)]
MSLPDLTGRPVLALGLKKVESIAARIAYKEDANHEVPMKSIILSAVSVNADRKAYAIHRMNIAAQRLLHAETASDEIQAGHWVLAWAVAAGARQSARALRNAEASMMSLVELRLH